MPNSVLSRSASPIISYSVLQKYGAAKCPPGINTTSSGKSGKSPCCILLLLGVLTAMILKPAHARYLPGGFMGCGNNPPWAARSPMSTVGDLSTSMKPSKKIKAKPVAEIFDTQGEPAFRLLEAAALRNVVRKIECGQPYVVSLRRCLSCRKPTRPSCSIKASAIWLDCPFEMVQRRIGGDSNRPLSA